MIQERSQGKKNLYLVLTCAHPVQRLIKNPEHRVYIGKHWAKANIWKRDTVSDLMLLGVWSDGSVQPLPLSDDAASQNESVTIRSYVDGLKGRTRRLSVKYDTRFLVGASKGGESGSGVMLNEKMVGVLRATGKYEPISEMVPLGLIKKFMSKYSVSVVPPPPGIDPDLNRDQDRREAITELRRRIIALESKKGEKGPQGDPGSDANVTDLRADVVRLQGLFAKLSDTPLTVQWIDKKTGKVTATVKKRLGETLSITFSPK